jgi:inosine-uridine nucleoside N-ribohydrolase
MSGYPRRPPRRVATLIASLAVLAAACSSSAQTSPSVRTGEPPTERIPVIIDADFDLSDIAAVAILLRDPAVDVRAITISGTGLVHCQGGRLLVRYLLDELGSPDIPFGCGREAGGPDAHPFPDAWRARADTGFGLEISPQAESGVPRDAVGVIKSAVEASPSAPTLVALGPLTNLEDALAADDTLADRLAGVHAMLGTIDAPGNVFINGADGPEPLEWNAYADPSAVSAVLASDVPISIVPLDATKDVPVPADLADQLKTDHKAGGADLEYELLVRNPDRLRAEDGQQLWDELAALALTDADLVSWEDVTVTAGEDGRLVRDDGGRSIRFASSADPSAVETALLDALRRGEPRATPFILPAS